jgi:hypothetical protein
MISSSTSSRAVPMRRVVNPESRQVAKRSRIPIRLTKDHEERAVRRDLMQLSLAFNAS